MDIIGQNNSSIKSPGIELFLMHLSWPFSSTFVLYTIHCGAVFATELALRTDRAKIIN